MIISKDYVFVHLQKTGGSFVERFLKFYYEGCNEVTPKHCGLDELGIYNQVKDKTIFGCVRNPWDWYVSFWASNVNPSAGGKYNGLFPAMFTEESLNDFNAFVDLVMNNNLGIMNYFNFNDICGRRIGIYTYRYLKCFYSVDGDRFLMDKILRMESLRDELASFLELDEKKRIELFTFPRVNVGLHRSYRDYYSDNSVELVAQRDELIIKEYGYEF